MRKVKIPKIEYVYIEPKTPEEKAEQQRILDIVYDRIFTEAFKRLKEKKSK